MATTMSGNFSNEYRLKVLDYATKNTGMGLGSGRYLGYATATIADTDTLSDITESSDLARTDLSGLISDAALDSGVPKSKNGTAIESESADSSEAITSWFITDAASGTSGTLIAYGNTTGSALNSNIGESVDIAINALVVTAADAS
jgi:hypothetical protein